MIFCWMTPHNELFKLRLHGDCPLSILCFPSRSEKRWQPWPLICWHISITPLKPPNRIQRNLTESKITTSSTRFVFLYKSEKQDGHPGIWLAETFSNNPLNSLNETQQNLTGSKISTNFTKFVFFEPIRKTRRPPRPLIGWGIFVFLKITERNSRKLYRKQDLEVLYKVCVFRADQKKVAALANPSKRWHNVLKCMICDPLYLLFTCKTQKNWCTVTTAPTIENHGGHSWTPVNQRRDQAPGRSQSLLPGQPHPPWMPATQRKWIHGGPTLDVDRHYIGSVTATTYQEKGIITLESNPSRGTVLPAPHGKGNKCDKNVKHKRTDAPSLWHQQ